MTKIPDKKDNDLESQLKRALADYDNLKKRVEKEREQVAKFANEALLVNLLGVVEGLEISIKQFKAILQQVGFSEIQVTEGDKFDGTIMEAIDGEGETVDSILSTGYRLHDKVVKPTRVKVSNQ